LAKNRLASTRTTLPRRTFVEEPGFVAHQLTVPLQQGQPSTVEKIVALYTARDRAISDCRHDARLTAANADDFAALLVRHRNAWISAWNRFDVTLDSANAWTETVLHLHVFHLLQTVSPHTAHLDVGVPARGWNGEAYRGHIFWTSCSSSRSSTSNVRRWRQRCWSTGMPGSGPPG
jgi:alpha,alpha-trehalase